jgi:FemAB-related protein (PEP-CTERM system-associated)
MTDAKTTTTSQLRTEAPPARRPVPRVVVDPLRAGQEDVWDAFVASRPGASHYQLAGWARVFENAFGQKPMYRVARSGDEIVGVLPLVSFSNRIFGKYLVSVPFLNRGGILAKSDAAVRALLDDARALVDSTGSDFCELRHVEGVDRELPAREGKVSMAIPLDRTPETIWKEFSAKVRNQIRKSEKLGATVREADPASEPSPYYDVFAENMRDLGTPVYSPAFFEEMFRVFPDSLRLNVVECEGQIAAAGICVAHDGFTEIHWAGARRQFFRYKPNMLLYWDAISHAADAGLREFCFGRCTACSGPHRFKKQWGSTETPLRWEYLLPPGGTLPQLNPQNPKFRLAIATWQKLPLGLTRRLGPSIVRHLP